MTKASKAEPRTPGLIYDDGIYEVTIELVTTPRRFYPVANTTAKIRRDPLWFALGITALVTAATFTYGSLLYIHELLMMWVAAAIALLIGALTGILSIDAIGHNNTMIINRIGKIRRLYRAIIKARSAEFNKQLPPQTIIDQ